MVGRDYAIRAKVKGLYSARDRYGVYNVVSNRSYSGYVPYHGNDSNFSAGTTFVMGSTFQYGREVVNVRSSLLTIRVYELSSVIQYTRGHARYFVFRTFSRSRHRVPY